MRRDSDSATDEHVGLGYALDASLTTALGRRVYGTLAAGPLLPSEAERFETGFDRSFVAFMARWLARTTRSSFLYRWLTAEPDPEVIVIDLRETYTVGPVIALLGSLFDWLAPVWRHSSCKQVTDGVATVAAWAARTRAGRTIVTFLEPPVPPDSRDGE